MTSYQLAKFMKHTVPLSSAGLVSVFTGSGSPPDVYEGYAVTTVNSGHVQFDDQGRMNIVWVASCQTGISYQGGKYVGSTDAVKVVLPHDAQRIHAYPIPVSELNSACCASCNRPIPY